MQTRRAEGLQAYLASQPLPLARTGAPPSTLRGGVPGHTDAAVASRRGAAAGADAGPQGERCVAETYWRSDAAKALRELPLLPENRDLLRCVAAKNGRCARQLSVDPCRACVGVCSAATKAAQRKWEEVSCTFSTWRSCPPLPAWV